MDNSTGHCADCLESFLLNNLLLCGFELIVRLLQVFVEPGIFQCDGGLSSKGEKDIQILRGICGTTTPYSVPP